MRVDSTNDGEHDITEREAERNKAPSHAEGIEMMRVHSTKMEG